MKIIVCIKQVPDPEAPQNCFEINSELLKVEPKGIPPVLSLFDENALEAALQIKDKDKDNVHITVISIGKRISNAVLQKSLAAGADELIKVEDDSLESINMDSHATAAALSATISKIEDYDLILLGRQSADLNDGQVGVGLAENLKISCITLARKVDVEGSDIIVERLIPGGYEVVKTSLPAVIVASNEIGELRYPTLIQRKEARKKPTEDWGTDEIGLTEPPQPKLVLKRLFEPEMRQGDCRLIDGDTPAAAGENLAQILKDDGIL